MTLADAGKDLATMGPQESLWQAGAGARGVTSGTLAVTTTYLRRLEGIGEQGWGRVAEAIGL